MTNLKNMWFMLADRQAVLPDFVLFNGAEELQGYTFDGSTISTAGNATPATALALSDRSSLSGAANDAVIIAGSDNFSKFELVKWEYDGSDWAQVGNSWKITSANFSFPCVAAMTSTRVALRQQQGLQTYDFDGTDWSTLGNLLANSFCTDMDSISATRIVTLRADNIEVHDFDGTDWAIFANFNTGHTNSAIASLTATLFAVFDYDNDELITYQLVGSTISTVGNALSIPTQLWSNMCALSATRVVFGSNNDGDLQAYDWDGSDWTSQGSSKAAGVPEWNNLTGIKYLLI